MGRSGFRTGWAGACHPLPLVLSGTTGALAQSAVASMEPMGSMPP